MKAFTSFAHNADGATSVEYALMIGVIIVAIFVAVQALGNSLNSVFTTAATWYAAS